MFVLNIIALMHVTEKVVVLGVKIGEVDVIANALKAIFLRAHNVKQLFIAVMVHSEIVQEMPIAVVATFVSTAHVKARPA